MVADLTTVHLELMANRIDGTADGRDSMGDCLVSDAWKCGHSMNKGHILPSRGIKTLEAIARALDVKVKDLFDEI